VLPAECFSSVQADAAPTLAAAEVLCLLTVLKPQCQQLLEGHLALQAPGQVGFGSCAKILSRLKTSPARLNVLSCHARMYEVLLENTTSPGLVLREDLFKAKDKALVPPLLDCIRKAVLEVRTAPSLTVTHVSVLVNAGQAYRQQINLCVQILHVTCYCRMQRPVVRVCMSVLHALSGRSQSGKHVQDCFAAQYLKGSEVLQCCLVSAGK